MGRGTSATHARTGTVTTARDAEVRGGPPSGEGVAFPEVDGERSTTATGRSILADAARTGAGDGAGLAERIEARGDWRSGYLDAVRDLTVAAAASREGAAEAAAAGLRSMRGRLRFERDGETVPLEDAATVAPAVGAVPRTEELRGEAEPVRELRVPYHDGELAGPALLARLDEWAARGIVEPDVADAIGQVVAHPEWLRLADRRVVLLGAGSEMGPLGPLLSWGAHVLAVDVPEPSVWERIRGVVREGAGRVAVPVAGADGTPGIDLVRSLPEALRWIEDAAGEDGLVLGTYAYADRGMHVRVTAAADVLATQLLARRPDVALAYLGTPTDAYLVPGPVVAASRERHAARAGRLGRAARAASRGRLFVPSHADGEVPGGWGVADGLVPQQGPNYALAKRLQRWRAIDAAAGGHRVSFNVAPASWTRSVTNNRALGAAYAGAHRFGVEIFAPRTTRALMAALLVYDLNAPAPRRDHPERLFCETAAHGGLWRAGYEPRSVLGVAALAGLPRTLRPR